MYTSEARWIPVHTAIDWAGDVARVIKTDKNTIPDTNTYARLEGVSFHNGTIDVDVCGKLLPDAPAFSRGFIGIVYRINDADNEFESFYIRPTNGRGCDDPVRKTHACQYFSFPGYTFDYFREFGITDYECALDDIALGEWAHIHARIREEAASFFVNGRLCFTVKDMKHGSDARGSVGLYVDIGTDGYFRNFEVHCED